MKSRNLIACATSIFIEMMSDCAYHARNSTLMKRKVTPTLRLPPHYSPIALRLRTDGRVKVCFMVY